MRIVPGFVLRDIAGEAIAIPTGAAAHRLSGLVSFNETGRFLFELLSEDRTSDDLAAALADAYEVEYTVAASDVDAFLDVLRENDMLVGE